MRYAIFFTPPPGAELLGLAHGWLGRDAFTGDKVPVDAVGGLSAESVRDLSSFPRLYGFHATLKAPFRPVEGAKPDALCNMLDTVARDVSPARIEALQLQRLGAHFALMPDVQTDAVSALAAQCVKAFEPFRAPLTQAEMDRRKPASLSERQRAHLHAYGYPYVLDEFRFHMTLTRAVADREAPAVDAALRQHFEPVINRPLAIDGIGLFRQPAAGKDFVIDHYAALTGQGEGAKS